MSHLTIVGDRQTGKTEALLKLGIADAEAGMTVLYSSRLRSTMKDAFEHAKLLIASNRNIEEVRLAHGDESVRFAGGGRFIFGCYETRSEGRGIMVNTHLIDDASNDPHPSAERVIRTARR